MKAVQPYRFPQAPLHAIAIDCASQRSANRKTDAQAREFRLAQVKDRQVRSEMTASLLVYKLEVAVASQARAAGKRRVLC